jgi:PAS domain-containing protein
VRCSLDEQRLRLLQSVTAAANWEMDWDEDVVRLSSNAQKLLGLETRQHVPLSNFSQMMHYSADREAFLAALKRARIGRKELAVEFRVQRTAKPR